MKKLKVIISGGGTGGHIFPAIAIAKSLEKKLKDIDLLFVGAKDKMEMIKIPEAGYTIKGLWISGFQRSLSKKNLLFPFKLISSVLRSRKIIRDFNPDLVIGTGGFASGPLLYVASKKGIPSVIQEQNSFPGITNRLLASHVDKICTAFSEMERFFPKNKLVFTGNPIRESIIKFKDKIEDGKKLFDVDNNNITVLVVGGSLGSKTINESIAQNLNLFKKHNLNLIWQTGISFKEESNKFIDNLKVKGISSHVFIKEMDLAYAAADIIVSRAGAIAISELCFVGKPIILVPSPNVAEDHQTKNAQSLVNKNSALMVKDVDSKRKLVEMLISLSSDKKLQEELSSNIKKLSVTDAAKRIADLSIDLVKQ
ncbi:MAG: undecaprenyldiphospho-muramoylpentapeptide beta-N-acetylglucosaminyltransferase [Flavobacteriales bacterium]|nr:undecaprenyldiphospho-muramoylpentapeptide beta-N-acetylglucosaminyltransferase [Flavobacteriales bacterium]|tara:strand:+ start:5963 stop:7066 length:1104 start_codon:yes stop_codon:yes gene_type:complete